MSLFFCEKCTFARIDAAAAAHKGYYQEEVSAHIVQEYHHAWHKASLMLQNGIHF